MPPAADAYRFSRTQDADATFAEQEDFKAILLAGGAHFEVQTVGEIHTTGPSFPLYTASIGATDPLAPVIATRIRGLWANSACRAMSPVVIAWR